MTGRVKKKKLTLNGDNFERSSVHFKRGTQFNFLIKYLSSCIVNLLT